MPIFFQQQVSSNTSLAIWKLTEDESFFSALVPLDPQITHPHKRLQHFAGRYLLKQLQPEFPIELIAIADTRKPYLPDEAFHFSISHCDQYAAAIVSRNRRVGVDIELVRSKITRIQQKFVSRDEALMLDNTSRMFHQDPARAYTLIWSVKEAVFKWFGLGGVDFREHIRVLGIFPTQLEGGSVSVQMKKAPASNLILHYYLFDDLILCYVAD